MKRCRLFVLSVVVLLLFGATGSAGQLQDGEGTNVIVVAKQGGEFRSIQAALDSINDASADNPYLLTVAPGVYREQIVLKPHIDIEGAGQRLTRIASSGSYTVTGGGFNELRSLTLECDRIKEASCWAIVQGWRGHPLTIRDVTIRASAVQATGIGLCSPFGLILENVALDIQPLDGSDACSGAGIEQIWECSELGYDQVPFIQMQDVSVQVENEQCFNVGVHPGTVARLTMRDSSVVVEGRTNSIGVRLWWGSGELTNVKVVAPLTLVASMSVRSSEIRGELKAFQTGPIAISHSHLAGRVGLGAANCYAVCDDYMNSLDENCQVSP